MSCHEPEKARRAAKMMLTLIKPNKAIFLFIVSAAIPPAKDPITVAIGAPVTISPISPMGRLKCVFKYRGITIESNPKLTVNTRPKIATICVGRFLNSARTIRASFGRFFIEIFSLTKNGNIIINRTKIPAVTNQ